MKLINIKKSNQGHGKRDYIFSISSVELKALKLILTRIRNNVLEKGDGKEVLKNAHKSITSLIYSIE